MRIALWVLAVMSVAPPALAQDVIAWSSERRLSKADFKGRAPASASNAMSWLNIDLSWGCEAGALVASARATFDPSQSWWRPASDNASSRRPLQRDAQLLEHEQLHFDLTEIAVRRIRKRLEELKDACAEPGGADAIPSEIEKIDRELHEEQRRYDRETVHGTDARAQAKWAERVKKLLH
jgi:hypothetical protein